MIIVQLIGGIGNQMFQYACGRHLALLNNAPLKLDISLLQNRTPFNPAFVFRDFELDMFNIQASLATSEDLPMYPYDRAINSIPARLAHLMKIKRKGYHYLLEWPFNTYNRMLFRPDVLSRRGDIYLAGYWASPNYFQDIRDILLEDFTFSDTIRPKCIGLLEEIRSRESVCINIRRKEFVTNKTLGSHGTEYVEEAVGILRESIVNPSFYVFSDDLDWCRTHIRVAGDVRFVGEEYYGPRYRDYLELMTACKHFIITNSTFAWWAAWLSRHTGKLVFIPANCFRRLNARDYIPRDWVQV